MKLSVTMPVYNNAPYLEETIRSILDQTYRDFEFIILDDASTDGSPEIIERLALYFRFFLKGRLFSDETVLKRQFKKKIGRTLDFKEPRALNDKLVWLNLNWERELAHRYCDKYLVRDYIADRIGPEVRNELYGVYESVNEIDLSSLPDRFILKITHGSGWNIVCQDKASFDWETRGPIWIP